MQVARARSDPADTTTRPARGRAVLVIEDDPGLRSLFAQVLIDQGYAVETAGHGLAGLERLASRRPDLILLDMMMPVMDGHAFREAQLSDPKWSGIPVIVISATNEFLQEDETLGAKAILGKPFDFDELLSLVETWAGRSA
jgi:CheY-like chemotaxis protein